MKALMQAFSLIADVTSVIGFLLTLLIFFNLKTITSRYVFQGRSPDLKRKLTAARKKLTKALENNLQDLVSEALASTKSALDSLVPLSEGALQGDAAELKARVAALLEVPALNREVRECRWVEAKLITVIDGVEHANKDLAWRMRDAG